MSILSLPPDLIEEVAGHLSQNDLLALLRTCSSLHTLLEHKLFTKIEVNSEKKVYSTNPTYSPIRRSGTRISSLFSLKLFLKKTQYAHHTRVVKFTETIPDACELIFVESLRVFLAQCTYLTEFYWLTEAFKLSSDIVIHNTDLRVLHGNISVHTQLTLPFLESLELGNFNDNRMCGVVHGGCLNTLRLYNSTLIIDEGRKICTQNKMHLVELSFKNITFSPGVLDFLARLDLSGLRRLTIDNCVEIIYETEDNVKRVKSDKFLWNILAPSLSGLDSLAVHNFQNELGSADLVMDKLLLPLSKMQLNNFELSIGQNDCKKYLAKLLDRVDERSLLKFSLDVHSAAGYLPYVAQTISRFKKLASLRLHIHLHHVSNLLRSCSKLSSNIEQLDLYLVPDAMNTALHSKFDTLIHRDFLHYYESVHAPEHNISVQFRNYSYDFKRCFRGLKTFGIKQNDQEYTFCVATRNA